VGREGRAAWRFEKVVEYPFALTGVQHPFNFFKCKPLDVWRFENDVPDYSKNTRTV
jgi:hypothetical protein